jgi:hypothetical protein
MVQDLKVSDCLSKKRIEYVISFCRQLLFISHLHIIYHSLKTMNMKKNIRLIFALFVSVSVLVVSCSKKQDDVSPAASSSDKGSAKDYSTFDNNLNSADQAVSDAQANNGSLRVSASCVTATASADTANPVPGFDSNYRKFTLDFTSTCDSQTRSGHITVYTSGSYITKNYRDSIVFSGYSSNGQILNGYKATSFSASAIPGTLTGTYSVNVQATNANGSSFQVTSSGQKQLVNYLIPLLSSTTTTGSGVLVDQNGNSISVQITKPIVLKASCMSNARFPVQGTVTYVNTATSTTSTIDFGNGTCDKIATLTVNNGTPTTFTMP